VTELRDYQIEAVAAPFDYWRRREGNPLVVMPTGSGKSVVLAATLKRAIEQYPETRVLVVTHRKELIDQDARAIRRLWPSAPIGIYSAGLGSREVRQITVAGIQSIYKKPQRMGRRDLVIIDEAHLVPFDDDGMYRVLLNYLRGENERFKVLGYTATPYRLSGGLLTRGAGKTFTSVCHDVGIERLVTEGWLSPVVSPETSAEYDTSAVSIQAGDFKVGQLAGAVEYQAAITKAAIAESIELGKGRKSCLVYCVSIEHAERARALLEEAGEIAEVVTGMDDPLTRTGKITRFRLGATRWLVSVDVLTTGFDAPGVDLIAILRPTASCGLYVQIVGRGMRIAPGKTDCLVLDYGGNVDRHGPITRVKPHSQSQGSKEKEKACPKCYAEVAIHKRECPECGHIWDRVPRDVDHDTKAARSKIMAPPPPPEWHDVAEVEATRWEKKDRPPTVCVTYRKGGTPLAREWVCPEHGGYAAEKFRAWWRMRGGDVPEPVTVDEAVERFGELREIEAIEIGRDGDFLRVLRCRLAPVTIADDLPTAADVPF
jgi:DNA repair protein RadD